MTCPHTGYIECDDDYRDVDLPCTATGRAAKERWEREQPTHFCQHDHGSCEAPLFDLTYMRCCECQKYFCEDHAFTSDPAGTFPRLYVCANCLVAVINCAADEPAWTRDARVWLRALGVRGVVPASTGAALKGAA